MTRYFFRDSRTITHSSWITPHNSPSAIYPLYRNDHTCVMQGHISVNADINVSSLQVTPAICKLIEPQNGKGKSCPFSHRGASVMPSKYQIRPL